MKQCGGWISAAEGPVVASIDPNLPGSVLPVARTAPSYRRRASAQQRERGLRCGDREHQRETGRANLIGERRQAERHAFTGKALGLTVQGLMPAILVEQQHGEETVTGLAAGHGVERRRRLCDRLALPTREPLARSLDEPPPAWITSSVSTTSSPNFERRVPAQTGQEHGAETTTRSRGRCSGKGFFAGCWRSQVVTLVFLATVAPAKSSSQAATLSLTR